MIKFEFYMGYQGRLITEFVEVSKECMEKIRLSSSIKNVFLNVDDMIRFTNNIYIRVNKNFAKFWNKNISEVK